jgi:hypothetical protein
LMKSAVRDFKAQVQGGDEVVFYFSGHGVQFGGSNYLIPIDITADSEAQVADDAIPLQRILDDLTDQKARFSLAIIDACRSNPFKEAGRAIGGRGLAVVTPATGQMIMYSAGAGQAALDNLGPKDTDPNGLFTRVLIQEMRKPGVPAGVLLKDVQSEVVDLAHTVNHEQVPALYDQSLGKFFFRPGAPGAAAAGGTSTAATATPAGIHVPTAAELDESYWQDVKSSTDPSDFAAYTKNFPKGMHVAEADMMGRKLQRAASAAKPAAPAATPRALKIVLVPGGPYPSWATTNLLPGFVGRPTITVNKDGSIDGSDVSGVSSHAVIDLSDPNNITGKQATHLGFMNNVQMRYPDGTTDAEVTIQAKLVGNEITGTWHDKFQHGEFSWTVRIANAP